MKVQDILTDEGKWCQGSLSMRNEDGTYRHCLVGALLELPNAQIAVAKIHERIGLMSISVWNDAPERTFAEVRALIEELDI